MSTSEKISELSWHNEILTKLIKNVSGYYPLRVVVKAISANNKSISEKLENNEVTTFGAKPLHLLAKRLNCRLVLVFVPNEETDSTMQLLYDIQETNDNFYKVLESSLFEYCARNPTPSPRNSVTKETISQIQKLMEQIQFDEDDEIDDEIDE